MMNKKVLICCNAYPPYFIGGAELVAHAQAKQLINLGYEVCIFSGDPSGSNKRHSFRREDYDGLSIYRVSLTHEDYDFNYVNFVNQAVEKHFIKLIQKFSPDIVHFHNIIGLSVGLIHIAKQYGAKTVLTLHDHWGFCFKNTLINNSNNICKNFNHCIECMETIQGERNENIPLRMRQDFIALQFEEIDAFISPSQYLADTYIHAGIPPKKMNVIWNGVDIENYSQITKIPDPTHIRFTFIGYFGRHKGIHILLDALDYLENKERILVNLIGNGDLFNQCVEEVKNKNLEQVVKFWGKIENIEGGYAQTDVFILPSIWPENQPVTITEAMAAEIPVIASKSGGNLELVEHGKTGYLFETGNARDLAKFMSEFIKKPELIRFFGENAFEKIKTDSLKNQVQEIVDLYGRIQEPTNDYFDKGIIIVCHGKHIDSICADVVKRFQKNINSNRIYFILSEWLSDDQIRNGKLFWIVDESESLEDGFSGLNSNLPLLVPEKVKPLRSFCIQYNCGLFYQNRLEASCIIEYLLNNDDERIIMGQNGSKAYNSSFSKIYDKKRRLWHVLKFYLKQTGLIN